MKTYNRRGAKRTALTDLPEELILEILLRLPVKSLLRLKCVSKSWLSRISHPHFASWHFNHALSRTRKILLFAPSAFEVRSIDFHAPLHDDSASVSLDLAFSPYQRCYRVKTLGSCRGLLLLQHRLTLYVWNPSTGVHWHIPLPRNSGFCTFLYGFGYDASTDDYLVVRASKSSGTSQASRVALFSVRANSWSEIGGLSVMRTASGTKRGLLFNGAIHWLVHRIYTSVNVIVVFDLKERAFSEIALPPGFASASYSSHLRIIGGFFGLCEVGFKSKPTKIWVMEQYKVVSSWRNIVNVHPDDFPSQAFVPLCSTESGDIVGTDNRRGLVKCDDQGHLKDQRFFCDADDRCFQVDVYTESLLSLPTSNN